MRSAICIAVVGAVCAVLLGCGGSDPAPAGPREAVRLRIAAPADGATVRGGTVDVHGDVSPAAAAVTVLGRPALVTGGSFSAVVPLEPGVNVVDVIATAPRRAPVLTALRVTRDVLVTVPQLAGVPEDELDRVLDPLGLHAVTMRGGGLLEVLRKGKRAVCEQDPVAGARVRRGTAVEVVVAKHC